MACLHSLIWQALAGTARAVDDLEAEMPRAAAEGEIPSIDDPSFDEGRWLRPEDEVLALEAADHVRAYPLRVLDYHEIVNDRIPMDPNVDPTPGPGEHARPVAVTFCPLCGSGIAWDRRVEDRTLTFTVSGRLYRNDLVMRDRETDSLWPQILGRALHGKLEGRKLRPVPTWRTSWERLRARHPDVLVLSRPDRYEPVRYEKRSHPDYAESPETLLEPRCDDTRLPRKTSVFGVARGNEALAIRRRDLREVELTIERVDGEDVILGEVEDRQIAWWTGGQSFTVEEGWLVGPEGQRWDPVRGRNGEGQLEPAGSLLCYWFAWADLHPGARLWHEED